MEGATAMTTTNPEQIKRAVQESYGSIATRVSEETATGCCGTSAPTAMCCSTSAASPATCCGGSAKTDPVTSGLYDAVEQAELPEAAVLASLGCGNPTALAQLRPGETVLDL